MDTKLATIALRGLTLPEPTWKEIRRTGVYCRATIQLVYQPQSRRWALRGEEAGGAVASIGHYVGFTGADGQPLPWTQRIQNFMPNGVHAVAIAPELYRVEMFRYESTYDVLITRHTLSSHQNTRPEIESKIVFFRRAGTLTTELWGKDSAFRGGARPPLLQEEWGRRASAGHSARCASESNGSSMLRRVQAYPPARDGYAALVT